MERREVRIINKKYILPVLALGILVIGVIDAQTASAQNSLNKHDSLAEKIATKFNLNKDEVQKVFDEEHATRQAEMQKKMQERLSTLVSDGKITETQKTLILNKQKEIQKKREQERDFWQNLTPDERRTQMETKRNEIESWANQNGIDIQYVFGFGRDMKGEGKGMHRPM